MIGFLDVKKFGCLVDLNFHFVLFFYLLFFSMNFVSQFVFLPLPVVSHWTIATDPLPASARFCFSIGNKSQKKKREIKLTMQGTPIDYFDIPHAAFS